MLNQHVPMKVDERGRIIRIRDSVITGSKYLNVTKWLVITPDELDTSMLSSSCDILTTVPLASSNSLNSIRT